MNLPLPLRRRGAPPTPCASRGRASAWLVSLVLLALACSEPSGERPRHTQDSAGAADTSVAVDTAADSKPVTSPTDTATLDTATAPDASDCNGTGCTGFWFAVAADMRYFAAPDRCLTEFSVDITHPMIQDYVLLTGSFNGWPTTAAAGAVPLALDGDRWSVTLEFQSSQSIEYKFLEKWGDTGEQWCTESFDCTPGAPNDQRNVDCETLLLDTPEYFRGACEAMAALGRPAFVVSPGDIDPPAGIRATLDRVFGPDLPWYPVVGNHEAETAEDMAWLRAANPGGDSLPGIVNPGPDGGRETTFSFDAGLGHFVVINQYFAGGSDIGSDGEVGDELYAWLAADLAATTQPFIFVFGHEPAFPEPDADNGRLRHAEGSLNEHVESRDRFWALLRDQGVVAYFCGHTHNYSAVKVDGVWQIDAGHARGIGDTGAPSTFLVVGVDSTGVWLEARRDTHDGVYDYDDLIHRERLF